MVSQALADSLAGSVGAVGALLLTYPLKTVYTLQALSGTGTAGQQALSILDVIKRYKLRGLYTGIEPNILESAISNGVYFFLYAQCKRAVISRRLTAQQDASERKSLSTDGALNHGANEHVGEATRKNAAAEKHRVECSTGQDLGILESLLSAAVAGALLLRT